MSSNMCNTYDTIDTQTIGMGDIRKIAEIEQDAWAHGIGEYVQCFDCKEIFSKSDIHGDISKILYLQTVAEICRILKMDCIPCPCCNGNTEFIYGTQYIEEVRKRYSENISFLSVSRNLNGEIVGFIDGYLADFSTIFRNEFAHYYSKVGESEVKKYIETATNTQIPQEVLSWTGLGIQQNYKSMFCVFGLIKQFFDSMNPEHDYYCISESVIGSNTHAIYHSMGAQQVGLIDMPEVQTRIVNKSGEMVSDIFIQPNIVSHYQKNLGLSMRSFLRTNKKKMQEVLGCSSFKNR